MQRYSPQSVGDVLRKMLDETSLQSRIDELKAIDIWKEIIGEGLLMQTGAPTVKTGVMSVPVPNAALRHELAMSRSRLREMINDSIGKETISEIRFTS